MARMDSLPTVSALMAAYNDEQYVGQAIRSALTQDYPPELLEVVVIDDGSMDSTAKILGALAEAHPGRVRDGGRLPVFTPATLSELRALADRAGD
jgi:glycosyltransferase involved in cell wall biosynthesis